MKYQILGRIGQIRSQDLAQSGVGRKVALAVAGLGEAGGPFLLFKGQIFKIRSDQSIIVNGQQPDMNLSRIWTCGKRNLVKEKKKMIFIQKTPF